MKKYFFIFLAAFFFLPQTAFAGTSVSFNGLLNELSFVSDSAADCDSSTDTYYLQTYIMNNAGPYYADPDTGLPVPENAWYSYYGGGSYGAPYTDVVDTSTLSPGLYYAFVTCINTQVNPSEYVPAHIPVPFIVL